MPTNKPKLICDKRAFSMIEVLILVYLISMAMISLLALVRQSIQVQTSNRNMAVASQLAQEGIEIVRNLRDNNWLEGCVDNTEWMACPAGINFFIESPSTIAVNYDGTVSFAPSNIDSASARVYRNNSSGFFTHNTTNATITPFQRLITIINHSYYVEVKSEVQWSSGGSKYKYIAETLLYNWK